MEHAIRAAIKPLFFLLLILAFFSHVMLTLEFDEAWILTTIAEANSVSKPLFQADSVTTTGGPYFLIQSILFQMFGANHYVARFFTFFALIFLLIFGKKISLKECPGGDHWLTLSFLLAVPGTIILSGTAYGTILSLGLLFAFFYFWQSNDQSLWKNRLISALLLAATVTTRVDLAPAFPALILTALLNRENKSKELKSAFWITFLGLIFVGITIFCHMMVQGSLKEGASMLLSSTGFRKFDMGIYISDLLNRISLTQDYLAISMMGLATWIIYRYFSPKWNFLSWMSWIILLLWVFRSPYPYYRYFYSITLINGFVISVALMKLLIWSEKNKFQQIKPGIYLFAVLFMIQGSISGIRTLAQGDLSTQNLEWARLAPYQTFKLVEAPRKQLEIAKWIQETIPANVNVVSIGNAMPLSYLSGRNLIPDWYAKKNSIEFIYLLVPAESTLPAEAKTKGKLVGEKDGNRIYKINN
jgi:hypothetical protein